MKYKVEYKYEGPQPDGSISPYFIYNIEADSFYPEGMGIVFSSRVPSPYGGTEMKMSHYFTGVTQIVAVDG